MEFENPEEDEVKIPIPDENLEELRKRAQELYEWYYSNFSFQHSIVIDCFGVTVQMDNQFIPKAYLLKK